jgi:hypothetical protein
MDKSSSISDYNSGFCNRLKLFFTVFDSKYLKKCLELSPLFINFARVSMTYIYQKKTNIPNNMLN